MGWVTTHPPERIDLDTCVTCGLCLPVCPTYRLTGDETASPRGRLAAIDAVDKGVADVDSRFGEIVDFCLQCRACETACPSLVPFGQIIESATAEVTAQMPSSGARLRRFALTTVLATPSLLRAGSIAIGIAQRIGIPDRGLRTIPLPQPSARGGSWGPAGAPTATLFVGCVADAWFSDIHKATIRVLVAAGYRVDSPSSQTCCGALAAHDGYVVESHAMAGTNRSVLRDADVIVVNVAGCGAHLKSDPEIGDRVRDITEIAATAIADGRLPMMPSNGERVAIQDPCHLEHGQGIIDQPRVVLAAAGYEVVDADPGGLCCGAAGTYLFDHPKTSAELGRRKAASVAATGANLVASANAGCEMQLRRFLGAGYEVRHPIELYADRLGPDDLPLP
ncbi:MAG: heterodisulfide reductase-related iron-sulfur binding cluster [Acidimicrobiia bacterium]|nr:MAG: heterodisulfide reductase-related iron-sulfur binding cluster [Acidimicrobiia bacterium]